METIFALATAPGRAGLAVVRVSGPLAHEAAGRLAGPLPTAGRTLRRLRGSVGELDEALVLTFEDGRSFTGEPVVELQLHGSPAVAKAVLNELSLIEGLRGAEPGEFTRRALENGRLDLAQVEGLADLIDAETEAQRRQAFRLFSGALGASVEGWRHTAIRAMALVEATIDFADEDVPERIPGEVGELISDLAARLNVEIAGASAAERIRHGFEVAIVGRPNVGKSTLLNRLAGREAAITSQTAGTTRDVIEVRMDIRGLPVTLLDTAGLREGLDEIERIGIARAIERAEAADLRLHLVDRAEGPWMAPESGDLVFEAKDDAGSAPDGVSGATGVGVDRLISRVGGVLEERASASSLAARARHVTALTQAVAELEAAAAELAGGEAEIVAEHLRRAVRKLDSIVGRVDVEDVLDHLFRSFCIGK